LFTHLIVAELFQISDHGDVAKSGLGKSNSGDKIILHDIVGNCLLLGITENSMMRAAEGITPWSPIRLPHPACSPLVNPLEWDAKYLAVAFVRIRSPVREDMSENIIDCVALSRIVTLWAARKSLLR
jgi:hypothetical protein